MTPAQILVVEDESIIAKDIQNSLKNLGYAVPAIASSGEEALTEAAELLPDLALMDIVLKGGMDGIERDPTGDQGRRLRGHAQPPSRYHHDRRGVPLKRDCSPRRNCASVIPPAISPSPLPASVH